MAYCDAHAPQQAPWRNKRPEASGRERAKIRRRVLSRAHYVCEFPGCHARATDADHIVNRASGGSDDLDNMQALCAPHHAEKSERERRAGIERKKAKR